MIKKYYLPLVAACFILFAGVGVISEKYIMNNYALSYMDGYPLDDVRNEGFVVSAAIFPGVETRTINTGVVQFKTQSYADAQKIYVNGYRLQISQCSGIPGSFTLKVGSKFMLDNRDNKTHQIVIGTRSYKLAAYDFAIVSINKPGSYNVTCDGGGSANILVQK